MITLLNRGLSHRSGLVRKGSAALLRVPKWFHSYSALPEALAAAPPVLANSFPKSGTHLLAQIVSGLPDRVNYGGFLASMTSSFRFRERTQRSVNRFVQSLAPGELVRGHLFFEPQQAQRLRQRSGVHYLIYRDLRDVVVSEAHYQRNMNRWHRLHPYFRKLDSIEEAITLVITGLDPPVPGISYPNIAERFSRYHGWLACEDCMAIRFEDLTSERQPAVIREMAEFYAARANTTVNLESCIQRMTASIAPRKSHTFRSGKKAGWQSEFTPEHRQLFADFAGDLLIQLGYEPDLAWVDATCTSPTALPET